MEAVAEFGDGVSESGLKVDCLTTDDERGVVSTCTVGAAASTCGIGAPGTHIICCVIMTTLKGVIMNDEVVK